MKKLYNLVAAVLLTASLWAQAPQKFSYQAVIRNASSALVVNQKVGVRISVLQTSASGVSVYSERHEPTTNDNGLIAIEIGGGTVIAGEFTKIDWSKGPFYVRTETDPTGGNNYTISGESQLLSVPYALFAANSIAGEKGPKGDTGAVGPQGPAGLPGKDGMNGKDGVDGKDGAAGPIGPKGDTGAVGPQGPAGLPGKDGKDGVNGVDGKDGAVGPIGPKGDTGAVGPQGPAGLPGKDGLNGKDGVNGVDGKDGAVGPIGPKGDTGAVGPQGPAGLPGKDGLNGKDGVNGVDGKDGAVGPIGPKGDTGAVGPQGPAGKDGMNGKDGTNGNDGAVGPIGPKGDKGDKGMDGKVEFQNLRVSATGDTLYLTNGNFVIIPGLSAANAGSTNTNTTPTSGYGPNIMDVDGNSYKTVYIGTQQWMGENLKTSKYNDGTPIPNVTDNSEWIKLTTGAWCNFENNDSLGAKYGKLYNWYAVSPTTNGNKNVCPTGWHAPEESDLGILIEYLGGANVAGGKMKEVGNSNWLVPNIEATNSSLFTAIPSGLRDFNDGTYSQLGVYTYFWSTSGQTLRLSTGLSEATIFGWGKNYAMSIRCLKDATTSTNQPTQGSIQTIDCGGATNNGTLTANTAASSISSILAYTGGNGGTYVNQTTASTGVTGLTAMLSAGSFANGNGTLTYNITGTPSSSGTATFAINIGGKSCNLNRIVGASIQEPTPTNGQTINDIDGNSYKTVVIGTQTWMAENLNVSKYNDGTVIPNIIDDNQWTNNTTGAYSHYNNDTPSNLKYGKLYNWFVANPTANGNKNVCPTGWHVPSDPEWIILSDYLGGLSVAGGKLKEVGTSNWCSPNPGASNSTLFTAIASGYRSWDGSFGNIPTWAYYWSSTQKNTEQIYNRTINCGDSALGRELNHPKYGFSIRCIKD